MNDTLTDVKGDEIFVGDYVIYPANVEMRIGVVKTILSANTFTVRYVRYDCEYSQDPITKRWTRTDLPPAVKSQKVDTSYRFVWKLEPHHLQDILGANPYCAEYCDLHDQICKL